MLKSSKRTILLTTSLKTSTLNRHIYESIVDSLAKIYNVIEFDPNKIELIDTQNIYDLLLYVGSSAALSIPIETIGIFAKSYKIPSVFWATEDPYEFDYRHRANDFDIYCSNDYNAYSNFLERNNVFFLPLAAPISDFRTINDLNDRTNTMFFCGYPYELRKLVINEILSLEQFNMQNLIVCGDGWDADKYITINKPINHNGLINYYSKSLFTLNIGRDFDISNLQYNLVSVTPGPRTFESSICGTAQIYYSHSLSIEQFYADQEEIITASSSDEIVDKFYYYSNHLDQLKNIVIKSQKKTLKDHTYDQRINKLEKILNSCGI